MTEKRPTNETIQAWAEEAIYNRKIASQRHMDAAGWLQEEYNSLATLEEEMIVLLDKFRQERVGLGVYDASAAAIIRLAEIVLDLAKFQQIAMRAHLATERARS